MCAQHLSSNLHALIPLKSFRAEVLQLLIEVYMEVLSTGESEQQQPEVYRQVCRCLLLQGDTAAAAKILHKFLTCPPTQTLPKPQLLAYQIAFDLIDLGKGLGFRV